jgi:hypothetical protein
MFVVGGLTIEARGIGGTVSVEQAFDPYYKWLGIPPEEQPPNHYRLLGIQTFESDPDVIQAASDQRMMHLRGYQTGKHSELSQRLLNAVAAAKICLLNAAKKAEYDRQLREAAQKRNLAGQELPASATSPPILPPVLVDRPPRRSTLVMRSKKRLTDGQLIAGIAAFASLLVVVGVYWHFAEIETPAGDSKEQTVQTVKNPLETNASPRAISQQPSKSKEVAVVSTPKPRKPKTVPERESKPTPPKTAVE